MTLLPVIHCVIEDSDLYESWEELLILHAAKNGISLRRRGNLASEKR